MLISDTHRFIFVHIRKAAGVSMAEALSAYTLPKPGSLGARLKSRSFLEWDYRKHRFRLHDGILAAKRRMPADLFDGYFKFAFVRNPWDRLVSEYEFIRQQPKHPRHGRVVQLGSLEAFVRMQISRPDAYQFRMLTDKNGGLPMDFVGRFENLDADWKIACERARIPSKPLPHKNKTQHRDFREYYDADSAALVAKHWANEIALFGYSFND